MWNTYSISYQSLLKELTFVLFYDFLGSYVLSLIQFFQYRKLQILQQENHKVDSHKL